MTEFEKPDASPKKKHILMIDDSPLIIKALHAILGKVYEVHFALSGAEGIMLAKKLQPDLILLDVIMPEMDGYEVCRRLKQDPTTAEIPVIFLTSLDCDTEEEKGLAAGAVDYITKPIRSAITMARIGLHLRLKEQNDKLRELATRDPLTQLFNRREFFSRLEQEWARERREKAPLSLLMIDIDHFKAYNDTYGHQAGDACLRSVADIISSALRRPADIAARYGGEEFCCLLPQTDATGARVLATNIMDRLAKAAIPHRASPIADRVTLSIGIATAIPSPDRTPADALREADEYLYRAKKNGRNRIEDASTASTV